MKKILVLTLAMVLFMFVLVACADDADEVQYDSGGNRIVRVASHNAVVYSFQPREPPIFIFTSSKRSGDYTR